MPLATLSTVGEYVAEARALLQDTMVPYRYPDTALKNVLGQGLYEASRLRFDLFMGTPPGVDGSTPDSTGVNLDVQYRSPLLLYMVGMTQLREEEQNDNQKAAALLDQFAAKLTKPGV